ncbi:retrotransposon protein [Hordeum vulgare]|nr:retrotransposon protein [Hordeum vulgare]
MQQGDELWVARFCGNAVCARARDESGAIVVEAILDAQGLWGVVAPAAGAAVDAGRCEKARAMLLTVLQEDLLMQVAPKLTTREVCDSLKVCSIVADRVKAAQLVTLRGEFDRLRMDDDDDLDAYAGKVYGMAARYAGSGGPR